jgi:ATP-dependent exoDNAse (exonuclease V) beta subunit
VEQDVSDRQTETQIDRTISAEASQPQWLRTRLVSGYTWQPPVALPALNTPPATQTLSDDDVSRNFEVALGIIVHRDLELLAQRALPEPMRWVETRQRSWQRQAQGLGVALDLLPDLLTQAAQQIQTVLADEQGRWILSARDQAYAEYPLSFVAEQSSTGTVAAIQHLVLDRLFVADGRRWLIDYKTASPDPQQSRDTFIASEVGRYRSQLRRYQQAAAAVFAEPISVGVYFTALPHLEVIG